jgi:1-acyl-sn-glycerol-3-phosphate acyltransferase
LAGLGHEKITAGANLYNDLAVDSLMKVEVLAAIHKELGIDIPDRLAYEMNTFADVVKFCREYKAGRSGDDAGIKQEVDTFVAGHTGSKFSHAAAYFAFRVLFGLYFRKSVQGLENLPAQKSFIIAANHSSLLDFPLILTSMPFTKIHEVFAPAARDYFYSTVYRKMLVETLFNTFPFERMGDFMKGLKICEALLKDNRSIILFPEGTREREEGIQSFKPGLGSLALHLNVPIVPVYIKGAGKAMPKGAKFPVPAKISVSFGGPIYPDQLDMGHLRTDYEKYVYISSAAFAAVKKLKN